MVTCFIPLMVTLGYVERGLLGVAYDLLYTNRQCSSVKKALTSMLRPMAEFNYHQTRYTLDMYRYYISLTIVTYLLGVQSVSSGRRIKIQVTLQGS